MRLVKKGNKIIAAVFDGKFEEGTKPLTEEQLPLQVIALKHPKGKKLVAHAHRPTERQTSRLVEMLLILSGSAEITLYDGEEAVEKVRLTSHQGVLLIDGGIGIEILEDAEMMEFKNGPFVEDKIIL